MTDLPIEMLAIDTIRTLAMDAVQQANSGHPGTPMGLAPVGYTVWQRHLDFDPEDPLWPARDRFVLSVGHASMLLYSLLFLAGVKQLDAHGKPTGEPAVTLDQIKRFRQLGSRTPGHPEHGLTSGVETSTGPLGQGCGNSVGMAIAERWLADRFNRPGYKLFDYKTYVLCGDGDMMEGVAREAASLAGHLKLSHLCWIYDSNSISIEGGTSLAFTDDMPALFEACGWATERIDDANDLPALDAALERFRQRTDRPTFIQVTSRIGYGAPNKEGTREAHGEPLGESEIRGTKAFYGWPEDAKFLVPDGVVEHFRDGIGARGARLAREWDRLRDAYRTEYPDLARELDQMLKGTLPDGWDEAIPSFPADPKGLASRDASAKVLNAIAPAVPWLLGGSADLAPSTKTTLTFPAAGVFQSAVAVGRNFHFGVREHAMAAALNGMVLSRLRAYGSGFLIFTDYLKPSLRLSALMDLPVIYIFTHDSIGVGEDGPTHQPIEQLAMLRATPGLVDLRPCDANEVAEAWRVVMAQGHAPSVLILSRQALPTLDRTRYAPASGLARGGYVLADPPDSAAPRVILIGTGSEVSLCVGAYERLTAEGVPARVVSLPSWHLFEQQDPAYRESVLPEAIRARVGVEQAAALGWDRYTGVDGSIVAMRTFGASAPMKDLLTKFGFSIDKVYEAARAQLDQAGKDSR